MKSFQYILGFCFSFFIFQEISASETISRVRVVKVRKSRIDKRQTQSLIGGRSFTDSPYDEDGSFGSTHSQRAQDNPYNAGNRNVDYPLRDSRQSGGGTSRTSSNSRNNIREDDSDNRNGDDGIPGDAGVDYPIHSSLPKTNFDCKQQQWPGYYADVDSRCQVFWICQKNRADAFLCPNGTLFNQQVFVCDWWFNVDCSAATEFYSRNQYIYAGAGVDLFGNPVESSPNRGNAEPSRATTSPRRPNSNLQHAKTTIIPLTNDFQDSPRNNYNRRAIDSDNRATNDKVFQTSKNFDDEFGFSSSSRRNTATTRKNDEIFATSTPILSSPRYSDKTTNSPIPFSRNDRFQESTTRKFEPSNVSTYSKASGSYSPAESRYPSTKTYPNNNKNEKDASTHTQSPYNLYSTKDARDNDNDAISHKDALRILSEIISSGSTPRQSLRNERRVNSSSFVKSTPRTKVEDDKELKATNDGYLPTSTVKNQHRVLSIRNYAIALPPKNFTIPDYAVSASGNNFYSPTEIPSHFDEITSTTTERTKNFNDFPYDSNFDYKVPQSQSSRTATTNQLLANEFESTDGRELFDDYDDDLLEFKFAKTIVPGETTPSSTTTTTTTPRPGTHFRFADEPVAEETTEPKFSGYLSPTTFRPNFSDVIKRIKIRSSSMIGTTTTTTTPPPQFLESPTFESFPTTIAPSFGRKVRSGRKRSVTNWNSYFNIA